MAEDKKPHPQAPKIGEQTPTAGNEDGNDDDRKGSQNYQVFRSGNASPDASIPGAPSDSKYDVNTSEQSLRNN